jgi:hypothetical protein
LGLCLDMHGLIFETSIWLLAGSTRYPTQSNDWTAVENRVTLGYRTTRRKTQAALGIKPALSTAWPTPGTIKNIAPSFLPSLIRLTLRETPHVVFWVGPPFNRETKSSREEAKSETPLSPHAWLGNRSMLNRQRVSPLARSLHCCASILYTFSTSSADNTNLHAAPHSGPRCVRCRMRKKVAFSSTLRIRRNFVTPPKKSINSSFEQAFFAL